VPQALQSWGFSVNLVKEQKDPDGNFPTIPSPNPEVKEALAMGIRDLLKENGDLFLATDPDADRMGAAILHKGHPIILTGNQIAVLLLYYLCSQGQLTSAKTAFITTIATTGLFKTIAQSFNYKVFEVLTGFKYIAALIREWEENKEPHEFLLGAEESYGYLLGTFVRDKDGVSASCLLAEAALYLKDQRRTLYDLLLEIYSTFGVYRESQFSLSLEGKKGSEQIGQIMHTLRQNPPKKMGCEELALMEDYLPGIKGLPKSNVLAFHLNKGSKLIIRPSGTEPKIKVYLFSSCTHFSEVTEGIAFCEKRLDELAKTFKGLLQ
jgi:phosphoglucomutase/phosphomannomutase